MISDAVRLVADELAVYIEQHTRANFDRSDLLLDNVADMEQDQTGRLQDKVIISVVNVEEESTLKNAKLYQRNNITGGIDYKEPPVHVNLYLLFCATYDPTQADAYETALLRLSLIIQYFQVKRVFTVQNSPNSSVATDPNIDAEAKNQLRVILELYTMTFEQVNHLWGALGGKQLPFVMYKARLVRIEERIAQEAQLIEEIHQQEGAMPN